MMHKKITAQKGNTSNEADRLAVAAILLKWGYTVRIGKTKPAKGQGAATYHVEYWEGDEENG